MTDQDPTQRYDPPAPPAPPARPAAAGDPVPTAPVAASNAGRGSGGRLRWLAVGALVLVVGGAAAAGTLLLTGDSGDPDVLAWAPADSLTYAELRLDPPGEQQAELAEVMSAFPGFDDQAAFPTKLDEALDQLVESATDGEQSWSEDIDPWFGRQVSVSVGPLPSSLDDSAAGRGLLLASVTDAAKAQAWAAALVASEGATTTTETYNGTTITVVAPPASGDGGAKGPKEGAYAIVGPVLAVGDLSSVKAAVDTAGTNGLNTVAQFQTAEASVSGDRLAFSYIDVEGLTEGAKALAGEAASALPSLPAAIEDLTVPWAVAALRAQDGSFVVETRNPHLEAMGPAEAADTTLASVLPPTTVLLAEGHDLAGTLTRMKDMAASQPEVAEGVTQLEQMLAIVGGWEGVVGWMGDGGVAVAGDGEAVAGGIVVTPTDAAEAERLFTQLRGLLALAGGTGITVTEEDHAGTTITVVTVTDPGALAGMTGAPVDVPANLSISYAVTDEVVVLGYGTDFTKAVLDARTGASLAETERFAAALAQAGAAHSALFWVDVAALRPLAEAELSGEDRAEYEADLKPYLDAFDSVIGTYAPGTDLDRGTVIIRVTGD